MLHLCVSGPVYVLDDVEVVLTNREVHFTFTTCIYFCSRNLLRIMVKIKKDIVKDILEENCDVDVADQEK